MNSGYKTLTQICVKTAFICLLAVAITGILMRLIPWTGTIIPFENLLHAHSHTAMLGWAFLMITAGFISKFQLKSLLIRRNIFFILLSVAGMFLGFLFQSYGFISISFSTLFVISAYVLLFTFWTKFPKNSSQNILLKRSILWFFVSTLGIWAIGPSSAILGKDHWLYVNAIQFFLHFQINGWLVYATLGFISSHSKLSFRTNCLLDISLMLTTFLPFYGIDHLPLFYYLNAIGVVLQMAAIVMIVRQLYFSSKENGFQHFLLLIILFSFILKGLTQLTTVTPFMAESVLSNRNFILAFLHLVLIGMVSSGLIYNTLKSNSSLNNSIFRLGFYILMTGFTITELLLFVQGLQMYSAFTLYALMIFSVVMLAGIAILNYAVLRKSIH